MPQLPGNNSNQQTGSGFTNLNRYLQANRSNQLGQAVGAGVQQAGQQASGAIQQAGQQFGVLADAEKQRLGQAGQQANTILQDPTKATDNDVESFQKVLNGNSQGPNGVANADELRAKAQGAQQLGQATGSQAGRYGLLQRFVGRGNNNYNLGAQTLDQTLLGQTGASQLKGARASVQGLGQQAEQQIGAAQAQGQELQGQARSLGQQTLGNLQTAATGYDTSMQQKLAAQEASANAALKNFGPNPNNSAIQLSQDQLNQLSAASNGVLGAGTQLFNADLSPYLSLNKLYDNKQAAQSSDDLAKAQALQKLGGQAFAPTSEGAMLQSYTQDPTMAGKFAANQFGVTSANDLSTALGNAGSSYRNQLNPLNSSLEAAKNTGIGRESSLDRVGSNELQFLSGQGDNVLYQGQNFSRDQINAALQRNLAQQASTNNQINDVNNQNNMFRVLQLLQPAQAANPVIGNGGQPLTSDQLG